MVRGIGVVLLTSGLALAQLNPEKSENRQPVDPTPVAKPDLGVTWTTLVERDEAGKIVPLKEPTEIAALRVNPMVSPAMWPDLKAALVDWQRRLDLVVMQNCDIIQRFDEGQIQQYDPTDRSATALMSDMTRPLLSAGRITDFLVTRKMLSEEQRQVNARITDEYNNAALAQLMNEANAASGSNPQLQSLISSRSFYEFQTREAVASYRRQLLALGRNADRVRSAAGVGPSAGFDDGLEAFKAAADDAGRLASMRAAIKTLSLKQQVAMLTESAKLEDPFDPSEALDKAGAAKGAMVSGG